MVWGLLGTLILIEALIFAQIYIESPDRYPNEQVRLRILPQPDDPKTFWLERLDVNPLHRAQKPVTTYWMRGDRYLTK